MVSEDEFHRVSLRESTDDSAWKATTSGGNEFDEHVIYDRWSYKAGRLSRVGRDVQGPFCLVLRRSDWL